MRERAVVTDRRAVTDPKMPHRVQTVLRRARRVAAEALRLQPS